MEENPVSKGKNGWRHHLAITLLVGVSLAVAACGSNNPSAAPAGSGTAPASAKTFYWLSHGSASDPFWVLTAAGADAAAKDFGVTVKQSFSKGDIAVHKEAFKAAIAAKADGIATTSPEAGALNDEVAAAKAAGIPVVFFNTDDPATGRNAFVGASLYGAGIQWARYLVDNKLVKAGDFVWLPVEAPGATYQVDETAGIASIFDPLGITYEVFNASGDPAQSLSNQTDYMTANASKVNAVIGLGDLVMSNMQQVLDKAGKKPGEIPVVGWGNIKATADAVKAGYVNAATWQYPDAQGYNPIMLLKRISDGATIGYDITTSALYDASSVDQYLPLLK
jgi:simple sugar transport system substrate-binding protein